MNHLATTNFSVKAVRDWTSKGSLLSRVNHFLMVGWPESIDTADLKTYHKLVNELSVSDGCILQGSQGRKSVLQELHMAYPGCGKMKALELCLVAWNRY